MRYIKKCCSVIGQFLKILLSGPYILDIYRSWTTLLCIATNQTLHWAYKSIFWQKFKILCILEGLCMISAFCMMVFVSSFQQASWNSEVFGHMTRMPGLPCMSTAESATKISNVWHHQVALTPAPSIFIAFCRTVETTCLFGPFATVSANNRSSLNIL